MNTPTYRTLLPMFDELQDERIVVRPYREDDAQELFEAIQESRTHIRPWLPFADKHQTVAETKRNTLIFGQILEDRVQKPKA